MRALRPIRSSTVRSLGVLVSWDSVCFPPVSCACAPHHVCVSPHEVRFPGKDSFSAEKGAVVSWKSCDPECWVTLPWPTSSPWLVVTFSLPWVIFSPLPLPSLCLSVSWGHFQKESNTDTNTGLVQLLFPQCTQYINIPSSFIGRAGWWRAPTDPDSGSLCRTWSLCSAPGPSTATTAGSAQERSKTC